MTRNGDRHTEGARGEEGNESSGKQGAHVKESNPDRWGGVEDGEQGQKKPGGGRAHGDTHKRGEAGDTARRGRGSNYCERTKPSVIPALKGCRRPGGVQTRTTGRGGPSG